jgi:Gluconate 2-dehydrogenase subunit 3
MTHSTLITSDHPLTELHRRTLDAVLEVIVPMDEARGLPSAREVGVLDYLKAHAGDYWQPLASDLDRLDEFAYHQFAQHFADLSVAERARVAHLMRNGDPGYLRRLALEAVTCYYQDDRVMLALGLEPRAPAPKGYEAYAGDFSLVEPVVARGEIWRRTDP